MTESPIRLVLAVVITCAVASGSLAGTYLLTRDRILQQDQQAEARSLAAAYQGADDFEPVTDEETLKRAQDAAGEPQVQALFKVVGGQDAGWALKMAPRGYGGRIQMVVAMDRSGKVLGVSILSMNETPGLGTQVKEPDFLAQFEGWSAGTIEADAKNLDAIAGATKSSRGVTKGIVGAAHVFEDVLQGEEVAGGE